jgi:hypothetical protein
MQLRALLVLHESGNTIFIIVVIIIDNDNLIAGQLSNFTQLGSLLVFRDCGNTTIIIINHALDGQLN